MMCAGAGFKLFLVVAVLVVAEAVGGGALADDHVLKSGDTLWDLSARRYGNRHYATIIQLHNRIDDPGALAVGTVVRMPTLATILAQSGLSAAMPAEVQQLVRARQLFMGREEQLWELRRNAPRVPGGPGVERPRLRPADELRADLQEAALLMEWAARGFAALEDGEQGRPARLAGQLRSTVDNLRELATGSDDGYGYDLDMVHQRLVRALDHGIRWARTRPAAMTTPGWPAALGYAQYEVHVVDLDSLGRPRVFGRLWSDESAVEAIATPALLGSRYCQTGRFTLDYGALRLAVSPLPLPEAVLPDAHLPLVSSARLPGLVLVEGELHGRRVLMELDSGQSRTVVDPELAAMLGLVEVANGVRIVDLRIGPEVFSVPSAGRIAFAEVSRGLPRPIEVGVGSDILAQVVLTVDYARGVCFLSRRSPLSSGE